MPGDDDDDIIIIRRGQPKKIKPNHPAYAEWKEKFEELEEEDQPERD